MTVFTRHLAELLEHCKKVDAGTIRPEDYIALQRLDAKIIDDRNAGKYGGMDRHILSDLVRHCEKEYRKLLKLD